MPRISVIIPTHGHRPCLGTALEALARQSLAPNAYEVIVVVDGGEAPAETRRRFPYPLRVIEQRHAGAAAARNRGAAASAAPVLLFLDDDMEAGPELLAAHLAAHRASPGGAVLGYFEPPFAQRSADLLWAGAAAWWAEHFAELAKPEHWFMFLDFCTGNVSLPKAAFDNTGGFDTSFPGAAVEDYELGVRLLNQGIRFQFAPEAVSFHHETPTLARALARAFAEGRGHVVMTRKHPEVFTVLPLRGAIADVVPAGLRWWLRPNALVGEVVFCALQLLARIAAALKLRRRWQRLHGLLHSAAYWRGVLHEVESYPQLRRFIRNVSIRLGDVRESEVDLVDDFEQLEHLLNAESVEALRIRYGATPVGRIAPIPGAESLRLRHVQFALTEWFGYPILAALWERTVRDETRAELPAASRWFPLLSDAIRLRNTNRAERP